MGKSSKSKASKLSWICPVCERPARAGTFTCLGCVPHAWVHPQCGGYTKQDIKNTDVTKLRCNKCKVR